MEKSFEERVAEAKAKVQALSAKAANEYRENDPDVLFIDPRDETDIHATTGIIPDALNVTLYQLNASSDSELPAVLIDRTRAIIAACEGGPLGALAAYTLKQRGYKNVRYIDGGTQAWLNAGFATVK